MRALGAVLGIVGGLVLLCGAVLSGLLYSFGQSLEVKVDPARYAKVVEVRQAHCSRYAFLPADIPEDAEKVAFWHMPGFLQGPDKLILRVMLPEERVMGLLSELEKIGRTELEPVQIERFRWVYPVYGMKEPCPDGDLYRGVSTLPQDFRVFLYECQLSALERNHGVLAFTAVSIERNEVVYYVINW